MLLHASEGYGEESQGDVHAFLRNHPRLVQMEEFGAGKRGGRERSKRAYRCGAGATVLGAELAERRTAGPAKRAAQRIQFLQPAILRLRI